MAAPAGIYLDASATTPPAAAVLAEMAELQTRAWANPSSLHGYGLAAAEALERSRWRCAAVLGCSPDELVFTSGGTESIHLALLGLGATLAPGRLLISA
ncbi:MAG: aminotransferase class V-fold PLP-dependent enzyme, partial [Cyanobium sp.]